MIKFKKNYNGTVVVCYLYDILGAWPFGIIYTKSVFSICCFFLIQKFLERNPEIARV